MWSYWFSPQDSNTPATLATATPTPDAATAATAATVTPTPADIHEAAQLVAAAMFHTTSYAEIFRDEVLQYTSIFLLYFYSFYTYFNPPQHIHTVLYLPPHLRHTQESRLEALTFLFECNLRLVAAKCPSAVHICKEEGVVSVIMCVREKGVVVG
ncbi:hypothetical protein B484DRAFT_281847 [Ochromonadaceae sp. CCMP2298]|nr:hypothetical protein B484DRAFT_281847 [Ochromonadaceae sp. CCMP2298]